LIDDGLLGRLREVHVTGFSPALADPAAPLSWRQVARFCGFNALNLGFLHQPVARWTPPVVCVQALTALHVPNRIAPETGQRTRAGEPDSVHALVRYQGGALGTYRLSGATWHAPERTIALFGAQGSLVYDLARDTISAARAGQAELRPVPIPPDDHPGWTIEADFLAAIQGASAPPPGTDLVTGARHMQFVEAVARSARHHQPVELPLKEFSNPSL
jgi:predicted dehydrogenase